MLIAELCVCAGIGLSASVGVLADVDQLTTQGRDSAGVWIVEHILQDGPPPRTLSGPPVFDRSGLTPNDPFFELREGRFGANGSVLVAEAVRIVQFDRSGELMFTVGRKGEGPGEFRGIRGVSFAGPNQIVVVDSRLRRLTVIRDGIVEHASQIRGVDSRVPWDVHAFDGLSFILGTGVSGRSLPRDRVDGRLRLPFLVRSLDDSDRSPRRMPGQRL